MDWVNIIGIVFGALGVAFGIHGHFSTSALSKSLITEKELIADKIRDFKSEWEFKRKQIDNEAAERPDEIVNGYVWKLRREELDKHIEVLDRFISRLEK